MANLQEVRFSSRFFQAPAYLSTRTLARSRQIEAEERSTSRQNPTDFGEFADDPEAATATRIQNDQIDFLDDEETRERYRDDEFDDDVFKHADGDNEERAIGLDKQPTRG